MNDGRMEGKTKGLQIFLSNEYDVTINMLLNNIKDGSSFSWSIFYLDDVGNSYHFNRQVGNPYTEEGYTISWTDLVTYSKKIEQLIFGVFIGSLNEDIKLIGPDESLYEKYDYYIEMIDGGIWLIFTKDDFFYTKLIANFKCKMIRPDFQEGHERDKD